MARQFFFLSSAHTSPAHLAVIGGDFVLESVVRCAAFVRSSEFGGCLLFGSKKCTASTGIAVGTSTVVRYSEEVRYWEDPLSEVPLYWLIRRVLSGLYSTTKHPIPPVYQKKALFSHFFDYNYIILSMNMLVLKGSGSWITISSKF